jgi:DNA-binding transcriptional regulator YbjK
MKERERKDPQERKEQILQAGIKLAIRHGYHAVTREDVAREVSVSVGLVSKYFFTMAQFKRVILSAAIDRGIVEIIAQGISLHDPLTSKLTPALRNKIKALFD